MKPISLFAALILAGATTIAHAQEAPPNPDPVAQDERATAPVGFFNEPNILDKAIRYGSQFASSGDGGETKNGFYPEFGDMIPGAGWISGGPGYRYWLFGDRLFVDASAALSWRMYKMAQARVELPKLARSRITAGAQLRWQDLTQVTYFGAGPDVARDRSQRVSDGIRQHRWLRHRQADAVAVDQGQGRMDHAALDPGARRHVRARLSRHAHGLP